MYYPPPLFTPVRPFESRPNPLEGTAATAGDVPVVTGPGTRENPLDLSVKNLRQGSEGGVVDGEDLLMLEHRKLASLAASHSLSALGRPGLVPGSAAALLDPTLYRLAYGPEALVPSPFCYDRATGVAVPTSLASHQLMSSILQQQQREQQQALLAARTTAAAQQAAVAAALMDPSSLPFGLRGAAAMTQREVAAALAATRGLYTPTLPTPVVLPGFPLYATTSDEKGAFTSLRNGSADKAAYLNGAAAANNALEAARFAEHLQRLREQHIQQTSGKCSNVCCTTLPGLGGATAVPCACCIQSPSQSALCARSPIGCIKDPATAATAAKVCGDYLQSGLTLLHRPAPVTTSELKLPVSSLCNNVNTTATISYGSSSTASSTSSSSSGFQPTTSWNGSLPGSSASGKTAFTVPKKKDNIVIQKEQKSTNHHHVKDVIKNEFHHNQHHHHHQLHSHEIHKRIDHQDKIIGVSTGNNNNSNHTTATSTAACFTYNPNPVSIKREGTSRVGDTEFVPRTDIITTSSPMPQKKDYDVKSILTPKTTVLTTSISTYPLHPKTVTYGHVGGFIGGGAQTTVTAVTPIVPTKCEGGTIPKTNVIVPPTLQSFRSPPELHFAAGRTGTEPQRSLPSPMGPPPLIAVGKAGNVHNNSHKTTTTIGSTYTTTGITTVPTTTSTLTTTANVTYGSAGGIVCKPEYGRVGSNSYQTADALRHQALLHGTYGNAASFQKNHHSNIHIGTGVTGSDRFVGIDTNRNTNHKTNTKSVTIGSNNMANNSTKCNNNSNVPFIKEEPIAKPTPPVSIPKPIPHHPTTKHMTNNSITAHSFAASPFLPYHHHHHLAPNSTNWMPPAHPNVTVAPVSSKNPISTGGLHHGQSPTVTYTNASKVVKSEPIPVVKKEPDFSSYSTNAAGNVLQSLLVRSNGNNNNSSIVQQQQHTSHLPSSSTVTAVVTTTSTSFSTTNCVSNTSSSSSSIAAISGPLSATMMHHNACSVIMPNPTTYPLIDYQYQNMIRGLNGLNLSRTGGPTGIHGCLPPPAIASTAPVLTKFEPKPECSVAGTSIPDCATSTTKTAKKRPSTGCTYTPVCCATALVTTTTIASTTTSTVVNTPSTGSSSFNGAVVSSATSGVSAVTVLGECAEKKRCVAVETNITNPVPFHPYALQYKAPGTVLGDVPSTYGPLYGFVPEPQMPSPNQQVLPVKSTRPVRSISCSTDTPPELDIMDESTLHQPCQGLSPAAEAPELPSVSTETTSPVLPVTPSTIADIQARNVRRVARARAACRLRKRCLARLVQQGQQQPTADGQQTSSSTRASQLYASWRYRRDLYRILRNSRESGTNVDRIGIRRKCRTGIVYKVKRHLAFPDGSSIDSSQKIDESCGTLLPIPSEMKKIMVNKALGETILHRAARLGYVEVVAYCLETNLGQINCQDNAGYTPLHECCSRGHLDIARALLQYGADVNASAAGGIRPLHDAVENDHVEVVRLLLSYGADPSISTYSGLTPLKLARSALMAEFLQGFIADVSGEMEIRPYLPWKFWGSSACLDPDVNGYDVFDGVPSDGEQPPEDGDGDDFVFEVSDSPHLPTFRLALGSSKAHSNYLRLSDILRKMQITKDQFIEKHSQIDVITVPRHEFEAIATCSQLLTGTKLDNMLLANRDYTGTSDCGGSTVELVRLDNGIRKILGIETISVR